MSEYSERCAVVQIKGSKLKFKRVFIAGDHSYHGCFVNNDLLYLGAVSNEVIEVINTLNGSSSQLEIINNAVLDFKGFRIKTIGAVSDGFILGFDKIDGKPSIPGNSMNSWVGFFKRKSEKLECVSLITFPDSQIDGHVENNGMHFFTIHDGGVKKGCIKVVQLKGDQLILVKDIYCESFPHGIDIRGERLVYTSYAESSVEVCNMELVVSAN